MNTIERLLELQEHDLRIQRIAREQQDVPARKARELERLNAHKAALDAAEKGLQARQAEMKQHELDVQVKKEKIAKLRTQQMELKTNKEFKTMAAEIETIENAIRLDEDQELVIMEAIETARAEIADRKRDLEAEQAVVQADVAVLDDRMTELESEREAEQDARGKLAQDLDPEWMRRYDAILGSKRTGAVLVSSEGGVCGGCHMALPPYQQHAARKRQEMVICGYCGRMLY